MSVLLQNLTLNGIDGGDIMFDLILYCIGQTEPSNNFPNNNIFIESEERYYDIWKCITLTQGIWYNLLTDENEIGGTDICEHIGYDSTLVLPGISMEISENLTPYKIKKDYMDSFKSIAKHLLNFSPVGMIYVLARYQSPDKEIVLGSYTLESYFSIMEQNNIYANVCYIISKHPNALGL